MEQPIINLIIEYLGTATTYASFIAILLYCCRIVVAAFSGKERFI